MPRAASCSIASSSGSAGGLRWAWTLQIACQLRWPTAPPGSALLSGRQALAGVLEDSHASRCSVAQCVGSSSFCKYDRAHTRAADIGSDGRAR